MRRSLWILAVASTLTLTTAAGAQQPFTNPTIAPSGEDVLYLKDGGMLRGTILEVIPNDHVTLQLANGQTATVQWSYLTRIEQRGRTGGAAAPPPPAVPAGPKRSAFVHIESEQPVRLEAVEGRKKYRFVCASPCDVPVDLDQHYRIAGDGVRSTGEFEINGQSGQRVVIEVDTSSKAGFVWGIVITSLSPIVALVGLVVYAVSSIDVTKSSSGQAVGAAMGFGGLAGIAIGIVMIVSNSSSKATQSLMTPQPAPQPSPPPKAGFEPSWRLPVPEPAIATLPILRF
jgi:hypothetical protein